MLTAILAASRRKFAITVALQSLVMQGICVVLEFNHSKDIPYILLARNFEMRRKTIFI